VEEVKEYIRRLEASEEQPFSYYDLTIEIVDQSLETEVRTAALAIKPNNPQRRGPQRSTSLRSK